VPVPTTICSCQQHARGTAKDYVVSTVRRKQVGAGSDSSYNKQENCLLLGYDSRMVQHVVIKITTVVYLTMLTVALSSSYPSIF
jgi:hypothetical protein